MSSAFLRLLALVSVSSVLSRGSTIYGRPLLPLQVGTEFGRPVQFCWYQTLRLLPGSVVNDLDSCEKCVCRDTGIQCESMVEKILGVMGETKCEPLQIGCRNIWVLKADRSQDCPPDLIPSIYDVSVNRY